MTRHSTIATTLRQVGDLRAGTPFEYSALVKFSLLILSLLASTSLGAETPTAAAVPVRVMDQSVKVDYDGILQRLEQGTWKPWIGAGYPIQVLGEGKRPRPLTSFQESPDGRWWISTPFEGYVSLDQGTAWTSVLKRETLHPGANLTAFSGSPVDKTHWAAGTSFHGLWLSRDAGATWQIQDDLEQAYPYDDGSREQVNAFAWSSVDPDTLYVSVGKNGSHLWVWNTKTGDRRIWTFPGAGELDLPRAISAHAENGQDVIEIRTRTAWWRGDVSAQTWIKLEDRTDVPVWDAAKAKRMEDSKDKHGFYLSSSTVSKPGELERHLDEMKKKGLNAVVIDFKNDQGQLVYDSRLPLAHKAGAVHIEFKAADVIRLVHAKGFYLIARQVVFKDKKLWAYDHNKYALWDKKTNKPWGNYEPIPQADGTTEVEPKEYWVDSYSSDIWDYNVAVSKELQNLGVDEVQYDYIRFPSDGPTQRIDNRYEVDGMTRMDALESFLQRARAQLTLPLSVDIYGYNGYFITDHLGQNMVMMSKYVDAISAMLYPSHFWRTFLPKMNYFERAKVIYQDGCDRTFMNTGGRVHVRPWVQTFLIGGELKFTDAQINLYLKDQLGGLAHSKASGFLMWNASNRYYMVTQPIEPYLTTTTLPY